MVFKNREEFEGQFVNDQIDGHGVFTHSPTSVLLRCIGTFQAKLQNGNGTCIGRAGWLTAKKDSLLHINLLSYRFRARFLVLV